MAISELNIIPLAGMFQAGSLVHEIAYYGKCDNDALEVSLKSILITDPKTVEEVYGNDLNNLRLGFTLMENMFSKEQKTRDMEVARYILGIIHLEKKLRKNQELFNILDNGITRIKNQLAMFDSVLHENMIANLAGVYSDSISKLQPQIMVTGESKYLTDSVYANKIRASLLALLRSTVLWIQKGGNRWHLILQRRKLMALANQVKPL